MLKQLSTGSSTQQDLSESMIKENVSYALDMINHVLEHGEVCRSASVIGSIEYRITDHGDRPRNPATAVPDPHEPISDHRER